MPLQKCKYFDTSCRIFDTCISPLLRQYVYFGTSKASKFDTSCRIFERTFAPAGDIFTCMFSEPGKSRDHTMKKKRKHRILRQ
jgi:hypothetical protein